MRIKFLIFGLLIMFTGLFHSLVWAAGSPQGTIPDTNALYLPIAMSSEPVGEALTPTPQPTATATATPTPTSTSTPTSVPTVTPTPTSPPSTQYICDHDEYNCANFATQPEAQAAYAYCKNLGFGDVHHLDSDNDGTACEALPPGFKIFP